MKLGSISKLARDVEYTTDKEAFKFRLMLLNEDSGNTEMLWKVYKLMTLTDYAPDRIRNILKGSKYSEVAEKYNITVGTLKKQIFDYMAELNRTWGGIDIIEALRNDSKEVDEKTLDILGVVIDDSLKKANILIENLEDKFSVDILSGSNINQKFTDIERDDFLILRNKLVSFSKPSQRFILENTDNKLISYGVFLLVTSEDKLSEEDRVRKRELETFTKIR